MLLCRFGLLRLGGRLGGSPKLILDVNFRLFSWFLAGFAQGRAGIEHRFFPDAHAFLDLYELIVPLAESHAAPLERRAFFTQQ